MTDMMRGALDAAGDLAQERIAKRAYEIWEELGRPDGEDREHWFQAVRELVSSPFAYRTPPH